MSFVKAASWWPHLVLSPHWLSYKTQFQIKWLPSSVKHVAMGHVALWCRLDDPSHLKIVPR